MKASEFTMFTKSKPWGYHPQEVEKQIGLYETTIQKLNEKVMELKQGNDALRDRCEKLQDELRAMHIEMSSLELPDTDELTERVILQDFKNYPHDTNVSIPAPVTAQSTPQTRVDVSLKGPVDPNQSALDSALAMFDEDDGEETEPVLQSPVSQPIASVQNGGSKLNRLKMGLHVEQQMTQQPVANGRGNDYVDQRGDDEGPGGFTIVT